MSEKVETLRFMQVIQSSNRHPIALAEYALLRRMVNTGLSSEVQIADSFSYFHVATLAASLVIKLKDL